MSKIVNPNAAGIDISTKEHYVAVPEGRSKESVRCFQSFTRDLHELANWLKECKVETVAMESTGVYWYHLYTVLLDYSCKMQYNVLDLQEYIVKCSINYPGMEGSKFMAHVREVIRTNHFSDSTENTYIGQVYAQLRCWPKQGDHSRPGHGAHIALKRFSVMKNVSYATLTFIVQYA
jgi:hypothetical protein